MKLAKLISIIVVMVSILLLILTSCTPISVETVSADESKEMINELYKRTNVLSLNKNYINTSDEYSALYYVYTDEIIKQNFGDDFDAEIEWNKPEMIMFRFLFIYCEKGVSEVCLSINGSLLYIELSKEYFSGWKVTSVKW